MVLEEGPMLMTKTAQGSPPTDGNHRPAAWSTPRKWWRSICTYLWELIYQFQVSESIGEGQDIPCMDLRPVDGQPSMVVYVPAQVIVKSG